MKNKCLPLSQQALVEALKTGVAIRYCPTYGGRGAEYWVRDDTHAKVTAAVRGLIAKGAVRRVNKDGRMGFWTLVVNEIWNQPIEPDAGVRRS